MRNLLIVCVMLAGTVARADDDDSAGEASRHFQRGVELYDDDDYRGALVEFKKAYALLPRANVLYDIGETEYQLQHYAEALESFNRFLAETGPDALHRDEVEDTVAILRRRVGRILLATDVGGCDVTIDDQPAGTTPLGKAMLVSVGPRTIVVTCSGRAAVTRHLEVASGETARVELHIPAPEPPRTALARLPAPDRKSESHDARRAWTITAILGVATAGVYGAAMVESRQLDDLKRQFPADPGALDRKANLTTGLAIGGDVLAGATLIGLCISTYYTLSKPSDEHELRVGVSPDGVALSGRF